MKTFKLRNFYICNGCKEEIKMTDQEARRTTLVTSSYDFSHCCAYCQTYAYGSGSEDGDFYTLETLLIHKDECDCIQKLGDRIRHNTGGNYHYQHFAIQTRELDNIEWKRYVPIW